MLSHLPRLSSQVHNLFELFYIWAAVPTLPKTPQTVDWTGSLSSSFQQVGFQPQEEEQVMVQRGYYHLKLITKFQPQCHCSITHTVKKFCHPTHDKQLNTWITFSNHDKTCCGSSFVPLTTQVTCRQLMHHFSIRSTGDLENCGVS